MAYSPFEYDDTTPQGWDPKVYRNQEGKGHGVSMKYGPKPPSPDDVAPRGTPAWRAAFNRMGQWVQYQLMSGATLGDMGFDRNHETGKQQFLRLSRGEYRGYDPGWWKGSQGWGREYYYPNSDRRDVVQAPTNGVPTTTTTPSTTTGTPGAAPGLTSTIAPPATPATPSYGYTDRGLQSAPSGAGYAATDSYAQFPRGGRKKTLRGLAGG